MALYLGDQQIGYIRTGVFSDNGYDTSSATATENDILLNKTSFGPDGKIIGKIPSMAGGVYNTNQTINTSGKYLTSNIVINVPPSGIDTSDANALPENLELGTTAYVNGKKVEGIVPKVQNIFEKCINPPSVENEILRAVVDPALSESGTVIASEAAIPLMFFGEASPSQVLSGATFTSLAGFNEVGTIPEISGGTYTSNQTISTAGKYLTSDIIINVPSGGAGAAPVLQSKTVSAALTEVEVTPDTGYDGLSSVKINAIAQGALASPTINTTTGVVTASIQTSGWINSATKATLNLPVQATKSITPSTTEQTAVVAGRYTTGEVTVKAMPTGVLRDISLNSTTGFISVGVDTAGYIDASASKTLQLPVKAATEYTPSESIQTISSGQYLTGVQTIAAIPNTYIGSAVVVQNIYTGSSEPDNSLGDDGDIYLMI